MKKISWDVKPQTQPTSTTCSPTALSILLGNYGDNISPVEVESSVPQSVDESGANMGTVTQQLATWCISRGYRATLYTFDCQVIDQSWPELSKDELLERLRLRKEGWVVPSLGKTWTEQYAQSYIDFVEAGGNLHIEKAVTTSLINRLLEKGPLLTNVSFSTLYRAMRTKIVNDDESESNDVEGRALNHTIVIYGVDKNGDYMIADPAESKKPGLQVIKPEVMLAGISTAQIECDNLLFQIEK